MHSGNNIDYENLKSRGFLRQRQDGFFVLRTRMSYGVYTKEEIDKLSEIAKKYGRGFLHATTRQSLEIPFIRFEDIPKVEGELENSGIAIGVSGARLRAITCCPGNNWCKAGLVDTFSLYERIEKELGIKCGLELPHKFKIAVSGCPNACTRPQSSEIGIHGQVEVSKPDRRVGYAVYIGGSGGRNPRTGFKLEPVFSADEVLALIARVVKFFKEKARPRQRLGALIDKVGKDNFLKEVMI